MRQQQRHGRLGQQRLRHSAEDPLPHPRMPREQRAKIFIPFDPLKGYQDALREKEGLKLAQALRDGAIRADIGGRYPLAAAGRAHEDLEGRRTTGQLVLLP